MFSHVDRPRDGFLDVIWIVMVLAFVVLALIDAPLLEILAPVVGIVLLWWLASALISHLFNTDPKHTPSGIRCGRSLREEYRRARLGMSQLTRLRHETEVALAELRRAGAVEREESMGRAISDLTDLHHALQHQAARARLIMVSMEAAEWLERTAPLLDASRWRNSRAAYRVDCIAREHPYGVRILLALEADPLTVELPSGQALCDVLKARLNDLYRTQVDVEAECAHRLARRMALLSARNTAEGTRERLKRCLRKHRHRHSA